MMREEKEPPSYSQAAREDQMEPKAIIVPDLSLLTLEELQALDSAIFVEMQEREAA